MRSAQVLSGNVMKIFRFRDHRAGGALYSGRLEESLDFIKLMKQHDI